MNSPFIYLVVSTSYPKIGSSPVKSTISDYIAFTSPFFGLGDLNFTLENQSRPG